MKDNLRNIRQLPKNILMNLGQLIVNRQGATNESSMLTEDILGVFKAGKIYQMVSHVMPNEELRIDFQLKYIATADCPYPVWRSYLPPHCCVNAVWYKAESGSVSDANILGGFGSLVVEKNELLTVPVVMATSDNLAFYGAYLVPMGDTIQCESNHDLPITFIHIGKNYVSDYLRKSELGGGEYIEYHDQPHLWIPRTPRCQGHILLGRFENNRLYLTGFKIPYHYGLYLSPFALHSDAYLIGDFIVVYTVTNDYSTVIFKNTSGQLVPLAFS